MLNFCLGSFFLVVKFIRFDQNQFLLSRQCPKIIHSFSSLYILLQFFCPVSVPFFEFGVGAHFLVFFRHKVVLHKGEARLRNV